MTIPSIEVEKEVGAFLSSRPSAAVLRSRIQQASHPVILDLSAVECISDSFADELFAVLVQDLGYEWFAQNVIVRGMSDDVRQSILGAIHRRCESLGAAASC